VAKCAANIVKVYCDMHAIGQQSIVETLFITVAKQGNNRSDQCFLCGLFTGYIAGQLRGQLVSE
jgi:hypothetical protein